MTFNAKNLHYEKQEPAFLRRLKAENTTERHNISVARPRKPRLATEVDDGPIIVDEQGENVTEKEYQDLLRGETKAAPDSEVTSKARRQDPQIESQDSLAHETDDTVQGSEKRYTQPSISNGSKKRKKVKVIAPESDPELSLKGHGSSDTKVDEERKTTMRPKKKKVKLFFGDPET